jgi:hypothetical protein
MTDLVKFGPFPVDEPRGRLTILQDDLFPPNILDRDQAVRFGAGELWPGDGVANVAPLWIMQNAPEDVD